MKFSALKYIIGDAIINKVSISDECWIMVYSNTNKMIITKPVKVSNFTFETVYDFSVKETIDELNNVIKTLNLSFNK